MPFGFTCALVSIKNPDISIFDREFIGKFLLNKKGGETESGSNTKKRNCWKIIIVTFLKFRIFAFSKNNDKILYYDSGNKKSLFVL